MSKKKAPNQHDLLRRWAGTKPAFALPRWFYLQHLAVLDPLCLASCFSEATFETFPIAIVLFERGTFTELKETFDEIVAALRPSGVTIEIGVCMAKERFETTILIPEMPVIVQDHDLSKLLTAVPDHRKAIEELCLPLERFAQATGVPVTFHHGSTAGIDAPYDETERFHIFSNTRPCGDIRAYDASKLFDICIGKDGGFYQMTTGAFGRGRMVRDKVGNAAAQLIGQNLFLLYPSISGYYGEDSRKLLERILRETMTLLEQPEPKGPKRGVRKAFVERTGKWASEAVLTAEHEIKKLETEIQGLQAKLADRRRVVRHWTILREAYVSSPFLTTTLASLPAQYARIRKLAGVVGIEVDQWGFQFHTAPLVLAHEGKQYALGTFTVRISDMGGVSVWSDKASHPNGIPHPHVSRDGAVCFGSATDSITKLTADFRFAEAAELILRWLRDGYSPELARHKIEEWPTIKEEAHGGRDAELVADAGAIQPGGGAAGDAHRSRSGGILDGTDAGQGRDHESDRL